MLRLKVLAKFIVLFWTQLQDIVSQTEKMLYLHCNVKITHWCVYEHFPLLLQKLGDSTSTLHVYIQQ